MEGTTGRLELGAVIVGVDGSKPYSPGSVVGGGRGCTP